MIATRTLRRARILIVGCGDVGLRCVAQLRERPDRARVFALTRRAERADAVRAAGATPVRGDLDSRASLARIAGLARTVLHLAPPQKTGDDDLRTRRLIAALAARRRARARPALAGVAPRALRPPLRSLVGRMRRSAFGPAAGFGASVIVPERIRRFSRTRRKRLERTTLVYASTTGVYGDCGGARIDETRAVRPANARAKRRVSAERQLRRATARGGALIAMIARIPGIYAANRLPLARLEKRTPALVASDDVYTSHIHADDLAAILLRLATRGRPGRTIHATDDSELKMGEYFDRVADAFGLARAPRVSRAQAERELEPVLLSFMRESRRLDNTRLKRELGVRLRYPDVDAFLRTRPPHP
ncbi:NAD-dependent epimerase/dehydratase family protein [Paraburkholderia acidiphila]|uniref:Sugar nucleotide-binding protein n=1 Tax=Paraburkholderia acidiphila TaxID=2571747 RepID=A0A7Z2G520_9BURK|nr:NAD-dependent epimerase/dehydratase family protein [Paraburkholderia acidiphila]QGZ55377.1 sugar nucleotide-binding protein [Paraburkholderia acidiphila]